MSDNRPRICEYPVCDRPSFKSLGLIMEPEPIMVTLCKDHFDAARARIRGAEAGPAGDDAFYVWVLSMTGMAG